MSRKGRIIKIFLMTGRLSRRRHSERSEGSLGRHKMLRHSLSMTLAFTMAEILISLTIIGVIAAITLPSLVGNINEKTWTAQRKALYSRMSQAIAMMPSLNGYGLGADDNVTAEKAAQTFITDGLSKVLKINNICSYPAGMSAANARKELKKCGFPEKFTKMGINSKFDTPLSIRRLNDLFNHTNVNVSYSQINTNVAVFETANGESMLTFYNPNCSYTYGLNGLDNQQNLMQPTMCANFIYDLNGTKGPNRVGKDIGFMTAFYPTDSEFVAPMPAGHATVRSSEYPEFTIGVGNAYCKKTYGEDTKMANIEELKSIFTNNNLGSVIFQDNPRGNFLQPDGYKSSTPASASTVWVIAGYSGAVSTRPIDYVDSNTKIFCIKK